MLAPAHHGMAPMEMARHEPLQQPVVRDNVVLTPTAPKQAMAYEAPPAQVPHYHDEIPPANFVPPQAERPIRPARMPRIDELPVPAQNQIRASRGEENAHDNKRMSLLQRLTTVGFGRRDEAAQAPAEPPHGQRHQEAPRPTAAAVHAEYAKRAVAPPGYRPAQGHLDAQGRLAPAPRQSEDDQLEIPAFLRRQAN
jgi:cell division protein FtsZ